jgi:FkbM family methyltransferase
MFISYASNFEDVLLNRIFGEKPKGFYIDVGADHPVGASTTKSFYDRGWRGINIEPGPNFALFEQERPEDINLKVAVTDCDGEVDFYINEDLTATSSVIEAIHPAVGARVSTRTKTTVSSVSLDSLVRDYVTDEVDFLKIDAEGAEEKIIMAADWGRFRPKVILAESTEPFSTKRIDQEWSAFLRSRGFIEVYFDGINTWFVREENREFQKHFEIPVNLLDDFIDYEKYVLRGFFASSNAPAKEQHAPRFVEFFRFFRRA